MAILVTILKWIGIFLLCLLGLLLFLVLMALFYPATYRAGGELGEKLPEDISVRLRVRWFFALAGFALVYEKGALSGKLTLFGIPIRRFPGKEKPPEYKKAEASHRKKNGGGSGGRENEADPSAGLHDPGGAQRTASLTVGAPADASDEKPDEKVPAVRPPEEETASGKKKESILTRIRRGELTLRKKIKNLIDKIRGIPAFFRKLWEKLSNIKGIIGDSDNRQAAWFVMKELLAVLKKYGPRRIETDLSYSAGDPAVTGQVLAGLSVLPFLYRDKVGIRPDFETEKVYVSGTFRIKGHIQAVHLLSAALRIYKNEQVKKIIQQVRS